MDTCDPGHWSFRLPANERDCPLCRGVVLSADGPESPRRHCPRCGAEFALGWRCYDCRRCRRRS